MLAILTFTPSYGNVKLKYHIECINKQRNGTILMTTTHERVRDKHHTPFDTFSKVPRERLKQIQEWYAKGASGMEFINGHYQNVEGNPDGWNDAFVVEKHVHHTDQMIGLLDGSITERTLPDGVNPEDAQPAPDTVIYLDKSGRPVSWLVDALWDQFSQPGTQKPATEFLNIDRTNWFTMLGKSHYDAANRSGPEDFDINQVPQEKIDSIRALFVEGELDVDGWQEQVWQMPATLDDQDILVVDEVKNRGGTLVIAQQVLQRAFPTARISADYFWSTRRKGVTGADPGEMQMESAPVWYDKDSQYGRGIGDISATYWQEMYRRNPDDQENIRKLIGWFAISAPLHDKDTFEEIEDVRTDKIRRDIERIARGVARREIFHIPDGRRDDDDYDARIEQQGLTLADFVAYRDLQSKLNLTS